MNTAAGNLLVLQGGGPSPVLNTSLYGVIDEARKTKVARQILGSRSGIRGLIDNDLVNLTDIAPKDIEALKRAPGASLGTTRIKPTEPDMQRILDVLRKHDIRHVLFIGGNGSLRGADAIAAASEQAGYDLRVIGIPKTIDNDIAGTDRCPGFGSAARYVAQSVRDLGMDVRALPQPVSIYETMGRSVGWLAGASALGKMDEDTAPHLIYLPEKPFEIPRFLGDVDRVVRKLGYAVVVVTEGIRGPDGKLIFEIPDPTQRDAMNRALPGDVAAHLAGILTRELKIRCRTEKPGLCGRSSMLHLSKQDTIDAELVGRAGVQAVMNGSTGKMISLLPLDVGSAVRTNNTTVRNADPTYELVPLSAAVDDRAVPKEWLDNSALSVGRTFLDYAHRIVGDLFEYPMPLMDTAPRIRSK